MFWFINKIILLFWCSKGLLSMINKYKVSGPLEPGSRVWQLPYQYSRNLLLFATVCHSNISEIYFNLPHQHFRGTNGPGYVWISLWLENFWSYSYRQASRSIWVLWIKKKVIYKFIKPHKNAAMLFFSNHTIKCRLDLS